MTEIGPLGGNPPCGSAKNLKRNLKTLSFLVKLSYHTKELVIYSLKPQLLLGLVMICYTFRDSMLRLQ